MTGLSDIALLAWPIIVVALFLSLPPRQAVLFCLIGGWLILPVNGIRLDTLPDYNKSAACCLSVFGASLLFHWKRWETVRPAWFDVPILLWSVCPILSSVMNGLGAYDGISAALSRSTVWLFPYVLGRVYFRQLDDFKALAVAIVLGGLVYVPLCLYEIRMSPQLHNTIYGFHQHSFLQTMRPGGLPTDGVYGTRPDGIALDGRRGDPGTVDVVLQVGVKTLRPACRMARRNVDGNCHPLQILGCIGFVVRGMRLVVVHEIDSHSTPHRGLDNAPASLRRRASGKDAPA